MKPGEQGGIGFNPAFLLRDTSMSFFTNALQFSRDRSDFFTKFPSNRNVRALP
jgi:hypothetical protein